MENYSQEKARALDQLRFEAVEKKTITPDMVDRAFKSVGFENPELKKEILSEYGKMGFKESIPKNPSEAYKKREAVSNRFHQYIVKQSIVNEIAKNLRAQKKIEDKANFIQHELNVAEKDTVEYKNDQFKNKDSELKKRLVGFLSQIPFVNRAAYRKELAENIRSGRAVHAEDMQDVSKSYKDQRELWDYEGTKRIKNLSEDEDVNERKLKDTSDKYDALASIPVPTSDELKEVVLERKTAIEEHLNEFITKFK